MVESFSDTIDCKLQNISSLYIIPKSLLILHTEISRHYLPFHLVPPNYYHQPILYNPQNRSIPLPDTSKQSSPYIISQAESNCLYIQRALDIYTYPARASWILYPSPTRADRAHTESIFSHRNSPRHCPTMNADMRAQMLWTILSNTVVYTRRVVEHSRERPCHCSYTAAVAAAVCHGFTFDLLEGASWYLL